MQVLEGVKMIDRTLFEGTHGDMAQEEHNFYSQLMLYEFQLRKLMSN